MDQGVTEKQRRKSRVDGVVGEVDEGEIVKTAEDFGEGTQKVELGEVDGGDSVSAGAGGGWGTGDAGPLAWSLVAGVPVGQGVGWVVEVGFGGEEIKAFLVEREGWSGRVGEEKEKKRYEEMHCLEGKDES